MINYSVRTTFIYNDIKYPVPYITLWSQDSSVGIATRYGLDGPGIESQWGRDFLHLFRLAL